MSPEFLPAADFGSYTRVIRYQMLGFKEIAGVFFQVPRVVKKKHRLQNKKHLITYVFNILVQMSKPKKFKHVQFVGVSPCMKEAQLGWDPYLVKNNVSRVRVSCPPPLKK